MKLIICIFSFCSIFLHDFHVSKCELNYDIEDKAVEIVLHVFIDDLENAIRERSEMQMDLFTENELFQSDSLISDYLAQSFILASDNSDLEYIVIGKEMSEDLSAVWIYAEAPLDSEINELYIKYSVLTEMFDDQENILQCRVSGKNKKFIRFDREDQMKKWNIN